MRFGWTFGEAPRRVRQGCWRVVVRDQPLLRNGLGRMQQNQEVEVWEPLVVGSGQRWGCVLSDPEWTPGAPPGRCQVHNQGGPDDARCNPEQAWRTPRTHPGWVRKHRQQPGEGLKQESTETTGDKKATDGNHTDIIGSTRNHRNPNGIRQKNTESRRRAALKLKTCA